MPAALPFQPSLFGADGVSFDASFAAVERIRLDDTSWLDFAPGWLGGADVLFEEVLRTRRWAQRTRHMYEGKVLEPRLTSHWSADSGEPLEPAVVDEMRRALASRYGVEFDSAGFNLYRDGADSVAWHGDRIRKQVREPIIPLVSLGEPRKFLLRPHGGGRSRAFMLGHGDLLVTGGTTQRTWQHAVPKVAHAGPRISIAFRYELNPTAYGEPRPGTPPR
ncbi:MAG TPA: alpha-ketoglutarate-dependent dioxygenase AlkB [Anaeromyxobacteraceae bacterium]|nr:alpha-ketoglutarate-dependent dioxygenase AlkB [Anaeromyxobacteraceae bacterium]